MNNPERIRLVIVVVVALILSVQCHPLKNKKGANHRRGAHHHRGHGKSTKKDSVNQALMAGMGRAEERDMDSYPDYNKAYINSENAAETSLLANQGIDDDSALKISNMAAMQGGMEDHSASSKKGIPGGFRGSPAGFNKPNVAGYSPDEYLLDANSWPEYRIKDSDYSKNYGVYPQGGGYQGGYMGGAAMPYGQTTAAGMEGPYGDGNYGFPPGSHMVNDEPEQAHEQDDQGGVPPFQEEGAPMGMPSAAAERLEKMRHHHHRHKHLRNPASQNFGDEGQKTDSKANGMGSGSGQGDASGSGAHDMSKVTAAFHDQLTASSEAKTADKTGQVSVDAKPDGSVVTAKVSDSTKTESKPQESSSESTNKDSKSESSKDASSQTSTEEKGKGESDAPHSTLGEFAKFLKSKGITLTINKENGESDKPQQGKESSSNQQQQQQQQDKPQPSSGPSSILPSTGQVTSETTGNPTINISPVANDEPVQQERPMHSGVMRWGSISPQPSQLGELFLRHKTKQQ